MTHFSTVYHHAQPYATVVVIVAADVDDAINSNDVDQTMIMMLIHAFQQDHGDLSAEYARLVVAPYLS